MTWSVGEVIDALSGEPSLGNTNKRDLIEMKLFDIKSGMGIGVDASGQRILVLPGQEDVSSFTTKHADFDPVCQVSWLEKDITLPSTATLTCRADFSVPSVVEAVAAVFIGLYELQEKFQNSGRAIWEMKELFENGFQISFSEETLVGLIGEIVMISQVKKPEVLINFWHSDPSDAFDFSSDNLRLEIKTSQSQARTHRFSSNQLGTSQDDKVIVASIILNKVEAGSNLSDLVNSISASINHSAAKKLVERIIAILGCGISLTNQFQFDLDSTIASLRFFSGHTIPRPVSTPGVIAMNWTTSLSELEGLDTNPEEVFMGF